MKASLASVDAKLRRANEHLLKLFEVTERFDTVAQFIVEVVKDPDAVTGGPVGRLKAKRHPAAPEPDPSIVLLAGELIYQLRSALDHLIYQMVIANEQLEKLSSRRLQFPIHDSAKTYAKDAPGRLDGVSSEVASIVEEMQPFSVSPADPSNDLLMSLQTLSNTDKHRAIPTTVQVIGSVIGYAGKREIFSLQSRDVVLADGVIFFSFLWPAEHPEITATLHNEIAFADAMNPHGVTIGLQDVSLGMWDRVNTIVGKFRRFV